MKEFELKDKAYFAVGATLHSVGERGPLSPAEGGAGFRRFGPLSMGARLCS